MLFVQPRILGQPQVVKVHGHKNENPLNQRSLVLLQILQPEKS
jgi:hypothetical protein